jgi:1-acyl-sn-glycerol-3-phosphate acyltransferase
MSLDRFDPADKQAFVGYRPQLARRFFAAVNTLARRLKVEVDGLENVPKGRALLVANHSFGWDVLFPMAAIFEKLDRQVWVLGEHAWWTVPVLRRLAAGCGVVDGTQASADRLLQDDQLVLVLPGGLREAVKPRELRYQLLWGHRYGFVRAALRNAAPLVPLASTGTDELFDFVGNAHDRGRRWFGPRSLPIPLPARLLPIPHLVTPHFTIGEPVTSEHPPAAAEDFKVVRRLRREVEGALHELIENELARRAGIPLD